MYQPGQGGGGDRPPYYQAPPSGSHPHPMAGMPPPAPMSGQMPPPHVYGMPPPGPPPPGPVPPGPPPPGPAPFVPGPPHSGSFMPPPQQPYGHPYNPAAYQQAHHQAQSMAAPFMPQQPVPGPEPAAGPAPTFGMPLNPLGLMAAGNLFGGGHGWGKQYVESMQQRAAAFTGGALHFHFAISKQYVLSKLLMLFAPYLKRWTYTRQPEQLQGGAAFKPPRVDVNSPDLYLPLAGLWTYSLLVCMVQAAHGKFKPDNMYSLVWSASSAWLVHLAVAWALLRAMALPAGVPWVELAAYTGYPFLPVCAAILLGQLAGGAAYWLAWAYGSTCMAVFLVRTMKRVIFQETRGYGRDLTLVNYLLLGLALFQFPYAAYLGVRP